MAANVYLNKILYQVAGNPAMSGAVKGKDVIMKRTCVEFDEKMTDLMQQIEDLNALKVGLFCKRASMNSEDFVKQLDDLNFELFAKYSTLFILIDIEIDASNERENQEYREVEAELQIYTNEYLLKCSKQEQIRYNNLWYRRDYIRSYIFDMILSPIQKSAGNALK